MTENQKRPTAFPKKCSQLLSFRIELPVGVADIALINSNLMWILLEDSL